jgi:predicted metal-dependent HD superfamily phosphohydrolase
VSDLRRYWPRWLPDGLRVELEAAYADPSRGYHDRTHLAEVLAHVEELTDADDPDREAVLLAAWFHDVVYDGQGDLEERSARRAEDALAGSPLAAEVARLVRLTAGHRPEEHDRAGQVLCDADLAILAADADRYASYTRGVRSEYSAVSDADFAKGRAAVLRDLLDKPSLFHTEPARRWWEQRARANVEAEIRSLTRDGSTAG